MYELCNNENCWKHCYIVTWSVDRGTGWGNGVSPIMEENTFYRLFQVYMRYKRIFWSFAVNDDWSSRSSVEWRWYFFVGVIVSVEDVIISFSFSFESKSSLEWWVGLCINKQKKRNQMKINFQSMFTLVARDRDSRSFSIICKWGANGFQTSSRFSIYDL